jgi:hypothetical protein
MFSKVLESFSIRVLLAKQRLLSLLLVLIVSKKLVHVRFSVLHQLKSTYLR